MKMRNMDDLNLKDAFAPMPETCHTALMDAARSVKEEKEMVRTTLRVALIAAAIIVATMVVAFAATQLGLIDLFNNTYDVPLPESAQTVLSATEQKTYSVGPLAITLRETLADGHIAYITTQAKTADGSSALIQMGNGSISDRIPDSEAVRLNVPSGTSFKDAATLANIPLYFVSSYLTIDNHYMDGDEMQDIVWDADGSALLVDMLRTRPDAVPKPLVGSLTLRVRQMDPAASSFAEGKDWQTSENISIPVNGVTAEKTYTPDGGALLAGYTVQSIKAVKTCAGAYLTVSLTAGEGISRKDVWSFYEMLDFKNAQGQSFPQGINLSAGLDNKHWPEATLEIMVSIDALPDAIQMTYKQDGSSITLK
jgi:hypothetical protein